MIETDNQSIASSDGDHGPKYYRDYDQPDDDYLLLTINEGSEGSRRYQAVIEVLRRLPENDYRTLADGIDTFEVFAPHEQVLGMMMPFFSTHQTPPLISGGIEMNFVSAPRVMYLSPHLEKSAWDIVVAVVAHEFAHIVLGHRIMGLPDEIYEQQEREVEEYLRSTGFERETKKHVALSKRRTTLEAREVETYERRHRLEGV